LTDTCKFTLLLGLIRFSGVIVSIVFLDIRNCRNRSCWFQEDRVLKTTSEFSFLFLVIGFTLLSYISKTLMFKTPMNYLPKRVLKG